MIAYAFYKKDKRVGYCTHKEYARKYGELFGYKVVREEVPIMFPAIRDEKPKKKSR